MSGSSLDGLDLGCWKIKISGDSKFIYEHICSETIEYTDEEIEFLRSIRDIPSYRQSLDDKVGQLVCRKLENSQFRKKTGSCEKIDLVSYHGHTAKHVEGVESIQLGSPSLLFELFDIPVAYNFRQNDVSLGGSGAPLMPFLDWLLFNNNRDIITLNIGGISNITSFNAGDGIDRVKGFDTGPGVSLINEAVTYFYKNTYDIDGIYSSNGKIDEKLLDSLMQMEYISKEPPKSTHTSDFGFLLLKKIIDDNRTINNSDLIRTLVQFTVNSILFNIDTFITNKMMNKDKTDVICSGGGIKHPIIFSELNKSKKYKFYSIDEIGINSDYKETLLMSVLGYCKVKKIRSNVPSVTGAKKSVILGDLYYGKN